MSDHGGVPVTDPDQLTALLGAPVPRVRDKVRTRLDAVDVEWLAHSPLCFVATSDAGGRCDVSPKGDPPGFALVLDETTVALPERPGNRRVDGFRNVLQNPHVGLLFVVPGRTDTLRVNGRATVVQDAPFLARMAVRGHRPPLALVVDVEEVFYHCQKAFLRSELWDAASWAPDTVPSRAAIARRVERPGASLAELEAYYGPSYREGLYRS